MEKVSHFSPVYFQYQRFFSDLFFDYCHQNKGCYLTVNIPV